MCSLLYYRLLIHVTVALADNFSYACGYVGQKLSDYKFSEL